MKKTFKNAQLVAMQTALEPLLKHQGFIGYAAAKNMRTITEALIEYYEVRNELIRKYGEVKDGEIKLSYQSPQFAKFSEEFAPIQNVEQEIDIVMIPYDQVINSNLLGEDMLAANWMLED